TLLVLIASPGGPFFAAPEGAEAGQWLLVPVICLTVISSTMLIYTYGNPLSGSVQKTKRITISSTLALLVVVAPVTLGKQFVKEVAADPLTPRNDTPEVRDLLSRVTHADLRDQRNFYRMASEVVLAPRYQKYFRTQTGLYQGVQLDQILEGSHEGS